MYVSQFSTSAKYLGVDVDEANNQTMAFTTKSSWSLSDLARQFGPIIRGWMSYYCRFRRSAFQVISFHLDKALARWAMRKYKRLRAHIIRAGKFIRRLSQRYSGLFPHWRSQSAYAAGSMGAR